MEELIREFKPGEEKVVDLINMVGENPDDIVYLVVLDMESNVREYDSDWIVLKGRQNTFDTLVEIIERCIVYPHLSYVMEMGKKVSDAVTVYDFMKNLIDNEMVITDFDINDYDFYRDDPFPKIDVKIDEIYNNDIEAYIESHPTDDN